MSEKESNMPLWAKIVVITAALPVMSYPWLLAKTPADSTNEMLIWFYPVYVVVSAVCAWICWPQRREVYWILIALMLLTHAAMFLL